MDTDNVPANISSVKAIEQRIWATLNAEFAQEPEFVTRKPFLAHYTSVAIAEQIIRSKQIWLSHPLYMNDVSEVAFALERAIARLLKSTNWLTAFKNKDQSDEFHRMVQWWKDQYVRSHFGNTFIFSTSETNDTDTDGLLSMWRSYGGNGMGAALVFDTSALTFNENSPFILEPVKYCTNDECDDEADRILDLLAPHVPEWLQSQQHMLTAANAVMERFKIFALLTKHKGFLEEKEWRVVYLAERDTENSLTHSIDYSVGDLIQPKLKFLIESESTAVSGSLKFDDLLYRVILGPSGAAGLSMIGFFKVLEAHAKNVRGGLHASTIPYRHRLI